VLNIKSYVLKILKVCFVKHYGCSYCVNVTGCLLDFLSFFGSILVEMLRFGSNNDDVDSTEENEINEVSNMVIFVVGMSVILVDE